MVGVKRRENLALRIKMGEDIAKRLHQVWKWWKEDMYELRIFWELIEMLEKEEENTMEKVFAALWQWSNTKKALMLTSMKERGVINWGSRRKAKEKKGKEIRVRVRKGSGVGEEKMDFVAQTFWPIMIKGSRAMLGKGVGRLGTELMWTGIIKSQVEWCWSEEAEGYREAISYNVNGRKGWIKLTDLRILMDILPEIMESCYEHNNLGKRLASDIRERILMRIIDEWMERGTMVAVEVRDMYLHMHSKLGVVLVNMAKIDRLKGRKVSRLGMGEMWEEEGQNQEEVEEGKSILEEMRESGRITVRYWLMNSGEEGDQVAKK